MNLNFRDHPVLIVLGTIVTSVTFIIVVYEHIVIPPKVQNYINQIDELKREKGKLIVNPSNERSQDIADINYPIISKTSQLNKPKKNNNVSVETSKLTPEYIREEIDRTTPFAREYIQNHFIGQKINWRLSFLDISHADQGDSRVSITAKVTTNEDYIPVVIQVIKINDVNLQRYPFFKITEKGAKIKVEGIIDQVKFDGNYISLKPISILQL